MYSLYTDTYACTSHAINFRFMRCLKRKLSRCKCCRNTNSRSRAETLLATGTIQASRV